MASSENIIIVNRIQGTVAYMRPLKLQASLRARDLARYWELVAVGHRFGKVGVLATMPSQMYSRKLMPEGFRSVWSSTDEINFVQSIEASFYRSFYRTF